DGMIYQVCGDHDGNGCSDWSDWTVCGNNTRCSGGECVAMQCTPGAHMCSDSQHFRFCGDLNWDTWYEWSEEQVPCATGQTCADGDCRPSGPIGFVQTAMSPSTIDVSWTAATGTNITGYNVYRDG